MWYKVNKRYVGTKIVRPSGWNPWANTVAYRPLTSSSTVNDLSWNSHTLTNSWSVTFGTYKWVDCAYFNGNQLTQSFSWSWSIITVSAWWYYENIISASTSNVELLRYWSNFWPWIDRSTNKINCSPWTSTNTIPSKNTSWALLTYTYDGSWHLKLYMNTTEIWTNNSASPWIWANLILCNTNFKWWLSNVIMEKSCWTSAEISDYYNLTKSNYWL